MSRIPVPVRENTIEMDVDGQSRRYEELESRSRQDKPSVASGAQSKRRRQYTEAELRVDT